AGAHRLEHGLAGTFRREIDRAGAVEIERDAGFVRRDQSEDDLPDVAAGKVVGFEWVARNLATRFDRGDAVIHDHSNRDLAQQHSDHLAEAHRCVRDSSANPEAEEIEEDDAKDESEQREDCDADEIERFHGGTLAETTRRGKFNCAFSSEDSSRSVASKTSAFPITTWYLFSVCVC